MKTLDQIILKAHELVHGKVERDSDSWPAWLSDKNLLLNGVEFLPTARNSMKYKIAQHPKDSYIATVEIMRHTKNGNPFQKGYELQTLEGINSATELVNYRELLARQMLSMAEELEPLRKKTGIDLYSHLTNHYPAFEKALAEGLNIHLNFPISFLFRKYSGATETSLPKEFDRTINALGKLAIEYSRHENTKSLSENPRKLMEILNMALRLSDLPEEKKSTITEQPPSTVYLIKQKIPLGNGGELIHTPTSMQAWWEVLSENYGVTPASKEEYSVRAKASGNRIWLEIRRKPQNIAGDDPHSSYEALLEKGKPVTEEMLISTPFAYIRLKNSGGKTQIDLKRGYMKNPHFNAVAAVLGESGLGLASGFGYNKREDTLKAVISNDAENTLERIAKALYWAPRSTGAGLRIMNPKLYEKFGKHITEYQPQIK